MKILIIENNYSLAKEIAWTISNNFKQCKEIAIAHNMKDAIRAFLKTEPELLVLNTHLEGQESFELFDYIDPETVSKIFISSSRDYAYQAWLLNPIAYICTPLKGKLVVDAIKAFFFTQLSRQDTALDTGSQTLLIKQKGKTKPVTIREIVKIKAEGSYSRIHINNNEALLASKPIGLFESLLKEWRFMRIHSACLVNLEYVSSYTLGQKPTIVVKDGVELVSRNRKKELIQQLSDLGREVYISPGIHSIGKPAPPIN